MFIAGRDFMVNLAFFLFFLASFGIFSIYTQPWAPENKVIRRFNLIISNPVVIGISFLLGMLIIHIFGL